MSWMEWSAIVAAVVWLSAACSLLAQETLSLSSGTTGVVAMILVGGLAGGAYLLRSRWA